MRRNSFYTTPEHYLATVLADEDVCHYFTSFYRVCKAVFYAANAVNAVKPQAS